MSTLVDTANESWGNFDVVPSQSIGGSQGDFQNHFMDLPKKNGDQIQIRPLVTENDPLVRKNINMHMYLYGTFHGVRCASQKQNVNGKVSIDVDPFCQEVQNASRFYFKKIEDILAQNGENIAELRKVATETAEAEKGQKRKPKTKEMCYQALILLTADALSKKTRNKDLEDYLSKFNKVQMKKPVSMFYIPVYDFGSDSVKIFACKWSIYKKIIDTLEDGKFLLNARDLVLKRTGNPGSDFWRVTVKDPTPLSNAQIQLLEAKRPALLSDYKKFIEPKTMEEVETAYMKYHGKRLEKEGQPLYELPSIVNGVSSSDKNDIRVANSAPEQGATSVTLGSFDDDQALEELLGSQEDNI